MLVRLKITIFCKITFKSAPAPTPTPTLTIAVVVYHQLDVFVVARRRDADDGDKNIKQQFLFHVPCCFCRRFSKLRICTRAAEKWLVSGLKNLIRRTGWKCLAKDFLFHSHESSFFRGSLFHP